MNGNSFPRIVASFGSPNSHSRYEVYNEATLCCLKKVLPEGFFNVKEEDVEAIADLTEQFQAMLPIVKTIPSDHVNEHISFFMLCRYRPNAFKFFFEMISRWLVPGKRLDVLMIYAVDFRFLDVGEDVFTMCEVMVNVTESADLPELHCNLPIIEMEARIGVESAYHARRILEIKGMTADEKTAMIQDYVSYLVRRSPKKFDRDLFTEMHHMLVICPEEFKQERTSRHLSRIIGTHYVFRKELLHAVKAIPERRHLRLRLFPVSIMKENESQSVLSVLVGVNFLKDKEVFEEQHLLTAIQNYLPSVKPVKDSFYANKRGTEEICTVYLEIKKIDGDVFTAAEIKLLRQELIVDLKDRIGYLMHPVFMPRNEEEIMRNVLALSNQIKYIRDLPQVFISFDEQTQSHLFFNLILVRVSVPGSLTVQDLLTKANASFEYIHDRCKMLGMLRNKYTKEASVFRVKISNKNFLRVDHSIDLYKARQHVVDELTLAIGEVRDYNGGMISKQHELLCSIRKLLSEEGVKYNDLLLENFFYSLTPVIMRTVLDPKALKVLFDMLLESIESGFFSGEEYSICMHSDANFVYVMLTANDLSVKDELSKTLNKLPRQSAGLATSFVQVHNIPFLGYIYRCDDQHAQNLFMRTVQLTLKDWQDNKKLLSR